jgi:serine phosphatase RsbU (regulator of sigma subunit)
MLLYTDGLTEARVGKSRLGTDRVANTLLRLAGERRDVQAIVDGVVSLIDQSVVLDDITLMAVRYAPDQAVA